MADLPGDPAPRRRRRGYLDWLRGVAVLIMIEGHLRDSWTRAPDRELLAFGWATIVGGLGAPLFLLLAGVAVSLSASAKLSRTQNAAAASRAVARRGLEIFALAFLFRIQAWVLSGSSTRSLLKVDILNIMGPSIVVAAALWGAAATTRGRGVVLGLATVAVAMLTPILRSAPFIAALPEPVEAYFRPAGGLSNFVFLPWAAFVFAGALIGLMIDAALTQYDERRLHVRLAVAGAVLAIASFALSHVPNPYLSSQFWTTSPAYFFLRLGLLTLAVAMAFAWESRRGGATKWSPLRQLGRTSLFIYWIHVEMVYGLMSAPLHGSLSLLQAAAAFALFSLVMLGCSILKDRAAAAWRGRHRQRTAVCT